MTDISSASRHGVTQLLLRLNYMVFSDPNDNDQNGSSIDDNESVHTIFDDELLTSIRNITVVGEVYHGVEPRFDIFDRPIYGLWMPVKSAGPVVSSSPGGGGGGDGVGGEWDINLTASAGGRIYENALEAVQDISFGSIKYRHKKSTDVVSTTATTTTSIDDVQIANTIAQCAHATDNVYDTESYNHTWRWYDSTDEKMFTIVDRIPDTSNFSTPTTQSSNLRTWDYRSFFTRLCGQDTTM
jgi:hypothetical protein